MTRQDDGFGRMAGPNPGSQSDFSNRPGMGAPNAQAWGTNALNPSEVGLMAQGARPVRPVTGQRPMFGGGSPVFAQMPSYTPVTRGADLRPQMPEPPAYSPYGGQPLPQHASPHDSGLGYPSPQAPTNYPSAYAEPAPSYQTSQRVATGYDAASNYQATDFGGQAYQPFQPAGFRGTEQPASQPYGTSSYDEVQDFQGQTYQDQGFADQSYPDQGAGDASFPESSFDQNFANPQFANQSFDKPGFADGGFAQPQGLDASFPEQAFAGNEPRGRQDSHGYDAQAGGAEQGFELYADEPAQDYGGVVPKIDPRRQLQAFDAIYDQPPQIALGSTEPPRRPAQNYYESERLDADFLDGGQMPPPGTPAKSGFSLKSRSAFMVGSALLGAIALGGALAFAYKQSGGGLGSEPPPLVQADNSPVKEAPDQPGGKEFPHKNKLIYDRLQNGDAPEAEKLVPRQEEVAVPAMPGGAPAQPGAAPAMPTPVASTDAVPPTTQALPGAAPIAAAAEDPSADGGPRKVKTMVVRPDGSVETRSVPDLPVEAAAAGAAPAEAAPPAGAQLAAVSPPPAPEPQPAPAPQQAAPQQAAPQPAAAPAPKPKPAAKPAAQQTAAATPQAAAGPVKYVVQVGSKKNQTEALASFADMQQKYPTLLANYRPIVQKADLGTKGTWYRLRIGPITEKSAASKLCSQLKSQGLADCLVMAQ